MGSNSNQKKLVLIGVLAAVVVLVILNFLLTTVSKKTIPNSPAANKPIPPEIKSKLDQSISNLRKNVEAQQNQVLEEEKNFKDECRIISTDPKNGSENSVVGKDDSSDYYYTLRVQSIEDIKSKVKDVSCNYLQLTLKSRVSKGPAIIMLLPSGITANINGLGKVSPIMYKNLVDSYITFRLKIQKTKDKDYPFKILEWQPIRSSN